MLLNPRCILVCTVLLLVIQFALATQEVATPRVKVLFEHPAEQAYAVRVAATAEAALDKLIPLFGFEPPPITLRLEDTTDLYNAFAPPLPRASVSLRRLFPIERSFSYRAEDDLELLLIHELTHIMQFSYLGGRGNGLKLGLVGENIAKVPPAWLLEGLAVWTESEFTAGGRRDDALTQGILESAALSGNWPSLADVSLSDYGSLPTYDSWPGGVAQYLFGVGFTAHLIQSHGFEAIEKSLAQHNASGFLSPFATSWQVAVGTDLQMEWQAWQRSMTAAAEARAQAAKKTRRSGWVRTDSGWYTRAPALSPDGSRLAWTGWPAAIMLADVHGDELRNTRPLLTSHSPGTLEWLDGHTLLYARPVARPAHTYSELFTLDTRSGRETQLTTGARAKLPAPLPGGCILYVTDDGTRSSLTRFCPRDDTSTTRYRTAAGTHLVGLATSRAGQVALSVWRRGFVDVALLEGKQLRWLTQDRAQDLEPSWRGEGTLLFRADRVAEGAFELYALKLAHPDTLLQLTQTVGGSFTPEAGRRGVWFAALGRQGYDVAWLPGVRVVRSSQLGFQRLPRKVPTTRQPFPVRPYSPLVSLAPYGWLPTAGWVGVAPLGGFVEASMLAQDDSSDHALRATLGYDTALKPLLGFYSFARYNYGGGGVPLRATPRPLRFSLQAGSWPFSPHLSDERGTVVGVKGSATARLPQDRQVLWFNLETSLIHLLGQPSGVLLDARAESALSAQQVDAWKYRTEGWRAAATGVLSATGAAPSLGAWLDASHTQPVGALGQLEFGLRAGYRPPWPIPITLDSDFAALASVGLTHSLPVQWRFGDGLYALERVTLEPRVRAWAADALYLGGDLTVSLDTVLNYVASLSFSGTLGYAEGLWTRVGVRLPLELQ